MKREEINRIIKEHDSAVWNKFRQLEQSEGFVTLRALAKMFGVRTNALTGSLDRLEAAGVIERKERIWCDVTHRKVTCLGACRHIQ